MALAAGGKVASQVDLPAFMSQLKETGSFWMAVTELSASHPFLCKRAAALQKLMHSDQVAIAIPNFKKYQERARQAAASAQNGGDEAGNLLSAEDREFLEWVKQVRVRIAAEPQKRSDSPAEAEEE